jgi:3-(3-hydroxy-phenyl)propionate hydroxylase
VLTAELEVRRADGSRARVQDPAGALASWLGGATSVDIRPDRIVGSAR